MIDYTRRKLRKIIYLIPKNKDIKIIEIGCGTGEITSYLTRKGYSILGIDIDKERIIQAKNNDPRSTFETKDVFKIDFSKYDLIIAWGLFEYILNLKSLLKKLEREMKPNTAIIFSVPNVCSLSKRLRCLFGKNPNREKKPSFCFTFEDVRQLIKPLKFKNKKIHSLNIDCMKNFCYPISRNMSGDIIVRMIK